MVRMTGLKGAKTGGNRKQESMRQPSMRKTDVKRNMRERERVRE